MDTVRLSAGVLYLGPGHGSKLMAYAEVGIPAYWRIERNDTVHVHMLAAAGVYTLAATVKPGETWVATWPYPLAIEPDRLAKG